MISGSSSPWEEGSVVLALGVEVFLCICEKVDLLICLFIFL